MPDRQPTHAALLGRLAVVGAALLFSTGGAAIKATTLTPWQVASFRSGIAAITLAILVPRALRSIDRRTLLVGVSYAATMILYVASNKQTTAAHAIFLQSTAPLYILMLGPRLLGERVRRSDVAWMSAIALGLAAFFVGGQEPFATAPNPFLGNLFGAASGVTWAFTIMGLRWVGSAQLRTAGNLEGRPGAAAALLGNLLACLACLPWAVAATVDGGGIGWTDWLAIGHLGILQIGVAYVLLTNGLERVPALEASLLLLVEPTFSPIWAWLVHGELPGPWAWAGGVLILGATTGRTLLGAREPS